MDASHDNVSNLLTNIHHQFSRCVTVALWRVPETTYSSEWGQRYIRFAQIQMPSCPTSSKITPCYQLSTIIDSNLMQQQQVSQQVRATCGRKQVVYCIWLAIDQISNWLLTILYCATISVLLHCNHMLISCVCFYVHVSGWEEWLSTGLYLSPGMKTYLAIPAEIVNNGWQVL